MTLEASSRPELLDMDKMISHMTREINSFWSAYDSDSQNKQFSINKVPQHILMDDKSAYEPVVLSIGPYHHGASNLTIMEKEKWRCLDFILKLNCKVSLQDYIRAMSRLEKQTRNCYSEKITMDRKKFLQMLLLDACFILVKVDGTVLTVINSDRTQETGVKFHQSVERLSFEHEHAVDIPAPEIELMEAHSSSSRTRNNERNSDHNTQPYADCYAGDWYAISTWHDLFLLENQLPFFVIETVYDLAVSSGSVKSKLKETLVECVEDILRQFPKGIRESDKPISFHHMLHLCHTCLRPTQKTSIMHQHLPKTRYFCQLFHTGCNYFTARFKFDECEQNLLPVEKNDYSQHAGQPSRWRQATQYHEAGILFKKREYMSDDRHSLLDIKFIDGAIEVPYFPIDENTQSLFKNLIAFEQTCPQYGNDITAYICFMSQIAATPADASLLVKNGIIVHVLDSDDDISSLFVSLTKDVAFNFFSNYYLKPLCHILESHYQSRLNRWMEWLRQNHLSNPWLALTLLAAVIMLLCTVVQTIFTVLAYESPLS